MLECLVPAGSSLNGLGAALSAAGEPLGVSEARPEVASLVSNAVQEFLRDLLERLSLVAAHRKTSPKVQGFVCVCVCVGPMADLNLN